jgi:RimJ/RimL family protein N-acetyltransferase
MSQPQSKEFIDRNFDHDASGKGFAVLVEQATGQLIGFAGLLPCDVLGTPDYEIGVVLRRSAWGRGYATEIGRGQLEYGFRAFGLQRLLAQVSPQNNASIAVLKKIGMKFHSSVLNSERGDRQVYVAQKLSE